MLRSLFPLSLSLLAVAAFADGGFIPRHPGAGPMFEPTQQALIVHRDGVEDLVLQVSYSGPAQDFAWLVPTPTPATAGEASPTVFRDLEAFCRPPAPAPRRSAAGGFGGALGGGVQVLAEKQVGIFQVTSLAAGDAEALFGWLRGHEYPITEKALPVLREYVRKRWSFNAMRVRSGYEKVTGKEPAGTMSGQIQPIRLTFRTPYPVYPLRISSLNGGTSDLSLFIAAERPLTANLFRVHFQREVSAGELNRLTGSKPEVARPLVLTWISRSMESRAMTRDLEFSAFVPSTRRNLFGRPALFRR